ncbi:MAG: DNA repair protein RadC [Pseudomonadota bacterium]
MANVKRTPDDGDAGFGERFSAGYVHALPLPQPESAGDPALAGVTDNSDAVEGTPQAQKPAQRPRRRGESLHHGHRARLRDRFLTAGHQSVADYEMLELVLFRAIPQRDVKPLAKRLLEQFGDFNGVISAPQARLRDMPGIGPSVVCELKIVEAAAHRLARARVMNRHALSSWTSLMEYCKTTMAHRDTEQFRILFLDRKNVLIADEEQAKGTVDHVPVYPREVVKRALELNASALILVHNHPSGDPTPSRADIDMTRLIEKAAKAVGVTLHDHVIVGKELDTSFRGTGLL